MADVLFVCVREDVPRADALADVLETAGLSVGSDFHDETALEDAGVCVIIVSEQATQSGAFIEGARRAVATGKALIACFIEERDASRFEAAPVFHLSEWQGAADDRLLDDFFFAIDRQVTMTRLGDEALPDISRPARADTSPPIPIAFARSTARRGFFERFGGAVRAIAMIAFVGGAAWVAGQALSSSRAVSHVTLAVAEPQPLVEASFAADEPTLAVGGPVEVFFEPPDAEARGRAGLEPPSASSVLRQRR